MQNLILTPVPIDELVSLIADEVEDRIGRPKTPAPAQDKIGLDEAIVITGLTKSSIYSKTMKGLIPHEKFFKRLVFSRKELEVWMKDNTKRNESHEEIVTEHLAKVAKKKLNKKKY